MKAQWQLVDIETHKAVIVGEDLDLIDSFREDYFTGGIRISWVESNMMFGDPISIQNPVGILKSIEENQHG